MPGCTSTRRGPLPSLARLGRRRGGSACAPPQVKPWSRGAGWNFRPPSPPPPPPREAARVDPRPPSRGRIPAAAAEEAARSASGEQRIAEDIGNRYSSIVPSIAPSPAARDECAPRRRAAAGAFKTSSRAPWSGAPSSSKVWPSSPSDDDGAGERTRDRVAASRAVGHPERGTAVRSGRSCPSPS